MADQSSITPLETNAFVSMILHFAGPLLGIALQVSCIMIAVDIHTMKSVKKLSSVPFACLFANGVLWTVYGWLRGDSTIYVPNTISIATAVFCMYTYYKYALTKPLRIYGAALIVCGTGLWLATKGDPYPVGLMGCSLSVLMSGSPLAVISTVIKEKSTAALPFGMCLITWLNNVSWVLYGYLIAHDNMIIVPNLLGLAMASVQMALFAVYGMPPHLKGTDDAGVKRIPSPGGIDQYGISYGV